MRNVYDKFKKSNDMMPDLTTTAKTINTNQESFGGFISKISGFFKNKINSLKGVFGLNAKNDLSQFTKEAKAIYDDFAKHDKVVEKLSKLGEEEYKLVKSIKIPWIPGVDTNYKNLVSTLQTHANDINNTALDLLEEVDTYISKIAGNEDYRLSNIKEKELTKKIKDYNKVTTDYLTTIINGKKLEDYRVFGDVVENLSVIVSCHNIFKAIIVNKDVNKVQKVFEKSELLSVRAEELYNVVKDGNTTMSKVRVNELVDILKDSAQIVTNVGAIVRLLDASGRVHLSILAKIKNL